MRLREAKRHPELGFGLRCFALLLLIVMAAPGARAHVGSKDVFETVNTGRYLFYVTVRPPNVIPGVATVEIRSLGAALSSLKITPLPVTGEASKHPPAADLMQPSSVDRQFFTGSVWMMSAGAWQVRVEADGADGRRTTTVPVLAVPVTTLHMQRGMGFALGLMAVFLVVALAGVVAASVREARLAPGLEPDRTRQRRGRVAMAFAFAVMLAAVWLGGRWWDVAAAEYAGNVFRPAATTATLEGNELELRVSPVDSDKERQRRRNDDYLPDHGKLMHLYAIRQPGMDAAFHLHPALVAGGDFRIALPRMPAGKYRLYGDVVHASGFPETLLASITIPDGMAGGALAADDASAEPAALGAGLLGNRYRLPDGYSMVWDKPPALAADTAYSFRFRLVDAEGRPASGMEPYLGMAGHAAFVKTDGTVFAHTHPEGSAAMADVMLADASLAPDARSMTGMTGMTAETHIEPVVDFPYGFPTPGRYRIFIQMKHAGTVETGVFDAEVSPR